MYANLPESIRSSAGDGTHVDRGTALRTYSETYNSTQLNGTIQQIVETSIVTFYNFSYASGSGM